MYSSTGASQEPQKWATPAWRDSALFPGAGACWVWICLARNPQHSQGGETGWMQLNHSKANPGSTSGTIPRRDPKHQQALPMDGEHSQRSKEGQSLLGTVLQILSEILECCPTTERTGRVVRAGSVPWMSSSERLQRVPVPTQNKLLLWINAQEQKITPKPSKL